jgi:hypothetical protein
MTPKAKGPRARDGKAHRGALGYKACGMNAPLGTTLRWLKARGWGTRKNKSRSLVAALLGMTPKAKGPRTRDGKAHRGAPGYKACGMNPPLGTKGGAPEEARKRLPG